MKVAVLVKQTFATEARIELDQSGRISEAKVKKIVNPYDEFAVEEAIQMVEKGLATHATAVSFGPADAQEALRQCLAMGADEALLVDNAGLEGADASVVAEVLAAALKSIGFELLLSGYVAVDDNSAQVAVRVAEILDLPHINVVSKIEVADGRVTAWREADGRTEVVNASLPALVTADKSLNKPRYPTLPNIMKAKKKPLHVKTPADLGITPSAPKTRVVTFELPPPKAKAKIFGGTPAEAAAALVQALRNEAKVV
jgi:electron transfer flavoprotein beta subunit